MIVGRVSEIGIPAITLEVAGQSWLAIIDTGFNGYLELHDELMSCIDARLIGRVRSLLAAGQMVVEDRYVVEFPFEGRAIAAEATFVPGHEILIGTRLLREYRLEINFVDGSVLLEHLGAAHV